PDSARARLPPPRGIHRRRERLARGARARVDRASARDGRGCDRRAPNVGPGFVTAITVTPNPFTLVPYDVGEITALLEEAAALAAWDTYAAGRAGRLGIDVRRPRQLYDFRLQHGFTNVADAAFERCWQAESVTWQGIREICKETGAADRAPSKVPVDLLRQK